MLNFEATYDVELADAASAVGSAWADGFTAPPRLTVSQWADQYRQIAKGAGAEPGQWRTSRNPALREIQDALSDHSPVRIVDFMKSAQIGATEVGINWTGYIIDRGIDSMIIAQPVKDLARSWATTKFDPAVALMPRVAERIESDNTLEKRYPGGTAWVIWTNSSNQLRQRTARFIFMDEVDEYPDDLGDQGSADQQLEARAMSYGDRAKVYRACTPTKVGASKIHKGYQRGDQRKYFVRCPHCHVHQELSRDRLQPNGTFACAANGCVIEEHYKTEMLVERNPCCGCGEVPVRIVDHAGVGDVLVFADECACTYQLNPPPPDGAYWQPTAKPEHPHHRSYHLWAAYTAEGLGKTWPEIAQAQADASANPDKQATFDNLLCGLPHEGERQIQNADEVEKLVEPGVHMGVVPDGALALSAGVDLGHDRFFVQVIGWGRGQRGRVVEYATIEGDPASPDGYGALDDYLKGTWRNAHGREMHITAVGLDGGNWTEMAAQFVKGLVGLSGQFRLLPVGREYRKQHVYLVRGRAEKKSDRAVYRPMKSEVNQREKTIARSIGVWGVGTSVIKHLIHGWLRAAISAKDKSEQSGEPEAIATRQLRFPGGRGQVFDPLSPDPGALPQGYFAELVCEYFDLSLKKWIRPKGKANEALDTLVYAYWAALSPAMKIDVMRESQWAALEARLQPDPDDLFSANDSRETLASAAARPTPVQNDSRGTRKVHGGIATREGWAL